MIKSWTLQNFKSIYDKTTIPMGPITVFAGANSSGKSTIIQSILLVTQTLQNPIESRPVVLNGPLVKLGSLDDICSASEDSESIEPRAITIGFQLDLAYPVEHMDVLSGQHFVGMEYVGEEIPHFQILDSCKSYIGFGVGISRPMAELECSFTFASDSDPEQGILLQVQPTLLEAKLRSTLERGENEPNVETTEEIVVQKRGNTPKEIERKEGNYEVLHYPYPPLSAELTESTASLEHFLPKYTSWFYAPSDELAKLFDLALPPVVPNEELGDLLRQGPEIDIALPELVVSAVSSGLRLVCNGELTEQFRIKLNSLKSGAGDSLFSREQSLSPAQEQDLNDRAEEIDAISHFNRINKNVLDLPSWRGPTAGHNFLGGAYVSEVWRAYKDLDLSIRLRLHLFIMLEHPTFSKRPTTEFPVELRDAFRNPRNPIEPTKEFPAEPRFYRYELPKQSEVAVVHIKTFFQQFIRYLGPLREEPKPIYSLSLANDPTNVGSKGEYTAYVLQTYRNRHVEYIPSQRLNDEDSSDNPSISAPLYNAVMDWAIYLGVASGIHTHEGKLGYELKVATSGDAPLHDLSQVGVGISQVLPILVMSLIAEEGSTLIFEQPELHLHPRVQTRLADFFITMSKLNKQCVIETHSEYLVNRFRYRVAASKDDWPLSALRLYFVEKEGRASNFREIKMNKYGVLDDWPKGFFDESEENAAALLRAALLKRNGHNGNGKKHKA